MVSKVSEITIQDVANYIRLDDYEESDIETYLNIAKNYIYQGKFDDAYKVYREVVKLDSKAAK